MVNYCKGNFVISVLYSTSLFKSTSLHSAHTGAYSFTAKGCWQHRMKEDKWHSLHKQPLLCKNWKMMLFFLLHKIFLRLPSPKIYKWWPSTDVTPVCSTIKTMAQYWCHACLLNYKNYGPVLMSCLSVQLYKR